MGLVRDPAFWRRFSTAVHLDEESKAPYYATTTSIPSPGTPPLKRQDSWLARQEGKKRRRTYICWAFWLGFAGLVAGIVIVVLWLKASGVLDHLFDKVVDMVEPGTSATATATPSVSPSTSVGSSPTATPGSGGGAVGRRALEERVAFVYYG